MVEVLTKMINHFSCFKNLHLINPSDHFTSTLPYAFPGYVYIVFNPKNVSYLLNSIDVVVFV